MQLRRRRYLFTHGRGVFRPISCFIAEIFATICFPSSI